MFGKVGASAMINIMKTDGVVNDILRIVQGVPSPYTYPIALLQEANGYLAIDATVAYNCSRRARVQFVKESKVAVRYNQYKDKLLYASSNCKNLDQQYRAFLAVGNYKEADAILDKLIPALASTVNSSYTFRMISTSKISTVLELYNCANYMIPIREIVATSNGNAVTTKPSGSFPMPASSAVTIVVDAPASGLHVSVSFTDATGAKTVVYTGE